MKRSMLFGLPLLFVTLAACAPMAQTGSSEITLSGAQEVPAVETTATGTATSTLTGTMLMVAGEFSGLSSPLMEIAGTPGHVHQAPAGENGDVVFPLTVSSADGMSGTFSLSTELTPEQLAAYNAGEFYVNLHTEMHGGGELRGQLMPGM
jgi:Cu/Zn superoxide dismutase